MSAVFHYLGPAFAVLLFARVEVFGVAWLRVAAAAMVFAAWRRPWRALQAAPRLLLAWGAVLAVMNCCFYVAIDRLPLGTVAAIEFLPVIALAALGARTARNAVALLLAVPGVYLLTGVRLEGEPLGVALAFANAGLFALYIVLAHRVSRHPSLSGIDGLAASMLVAAAVVTPIGGWAAAEALDDPVALAAGAGVGICSSVIPYVADQLAMRSLARASYALMVSLLPATATVIGLLVLAQVPTAAEAAGVALVVAGVGLHRAQESPAMPDYTVVNLKRDVEDMAPKFGYAPNVEARFARTNLALENSGVSYFRIAPDFRMPFGHSHSEQEEVYLVLSGSARIKLDDEIVELSALDALRIAPGLTRGMEAGPEGAEIVAFGAPNNDNKDVEMKPGWWQD